MSDSTSSGSTSPGRCGSTPSWWRCSARWCGSEWACYVVTDAASSVARTGGTDCWRALAAQARQLAGQGEVACGIRAGIRAVAAKGDPVGPDSGGRVESQTARALTATRTACPTHPQQRAAVDPARVLEVTPYALAGTRHGFLGEYQTLTRREDAPERQDRTPGLRIEHRTALQRDSRRSWPVCTGTSGIQWSGIVEASRYSTDAPSGIGSGGGSARRFSWYASKRSTGRPSAPGTMRSIAQAKLAISSRMKSTCSTGSLLRLDASVGGRKNSRSAASTSCVSGRPATAG